MCKCARCRCFGTRLTDCGARHTFQKRKSVSAVGTKGSEERPVRRARMTRASAWSRSSRSAGGTSRSEGRVEGRDSVRGGEIAEEKAERGSTVRPSREWEGPRSGDL